MPGARLILNARYFHIAKVGEKADGKHVMTQDAAMGLVNYVGTRESVILNMPDQLSLNGEEVASLNLDPLKLKKEVADKPATHKQINLLADLLKEFPEAKQSLEYQDFKRNPTIENATELISHAAEFGLGFAVDLGKAKNLVEYVGKRPGVDRVGEHGLFSSSTNVDIKKAQEEIANCKGNIWTHVISLRREDADALGYDTQKPWRDLVMQKIDVIAKASNIPVSELHWYAGMHNTTHHPHIHLFIFSDNPKSGKLTVDGINKIKSEFSTVIFADERRHIYEHKTEMRDEIKQKIDDILSGPQGNVSDQFSNEEWNILSKKMLCLSQDVKGRSGKLQYGWIKDSNIRQQVNEILVDLAKARDIQNLYELYCEDHKELQRMYRNDPQDITPLLKDKEFKSIKNKIIREAVQLGNLIPEYELALEEMPVKYQTHNDYVTSAEMDEYAYPPLSDEESLFSSDSKSPPDFIPYSGYGASAEPEASEDYESPIPHMEKETFDKCYQKAFDGDTNARYRLAKIYFYGKGIDRNYEQARMWYGLAAAGGHAYAKYELGKMYLYGLGIDKDPQLGEEYCLDAYWKFRSMVADKVGFDIGKYVDEGTAILDGYSGDKDSSYLMYCLGRMEYAGEGLEQDYEKAFQWYGLAAQAGHVHSNYCLAKMYYGGEVVIQDYEQAKCFYEQAARGHDKYAYYALAKMYDNGIGTEQNYAKAAEYYTRASQGNVPYADYRLAHMFAIGQGVEQDQELSEILYRKALNEFIEQEKQQPDAAVEFRIAEMYLRGIGVEQNIDEAVKWLTLCCEKENPRAQFELAALYQKGESIQRDEEKAQTLYSAALAGFVNEEKNTPAASIEYRIASMFAKGYGTDQDAEKSFRWYKQAADNGHAHAAYCAAQACYTGTGTEQDYAESVKWYEKAVTGGDTYAMYALGKMYRDGNAHTAFKYFLSAAKLEHGFAQYAVAKALLAGEGIEKNVPEAIKWFEKCAERGNHFAEYKLAVLFSEGKEVPKDEIKAQKHYAAALAGFLQMEQESPDADMEYRIAGMFLNGKGCAIDYPTAALWLSRCSAAGNFMAQYQLAGLLYTGKGIPQNEQKAQLLYASALRGFTESIKVNPNSDMLYLIGIMQERGLGTSRDIQTAKYFYSVAAQIGNESAADRLQQIETAENKAVLNSVFGIFRAFAQSMGNNINDSTRHKYRQDKKLLQKQRELKHSHGQKEEFGQYM